MMHRRLCARKLAIFCALMLVNTFVFFLVINLFASFRHTLFATVIICYRFYLSSHIFIDRFDSFILSFHCSQFKLYFGFALLFCFVSFVLCVCTRLVFAVWKLLSNYLLYLPVKCRQLTRLKRIDHIWIW